jgi:vacuolar-type H+-ATPase subunit I/STV1
MAEHESTRIVARILGPSAIVVGVAVIARRLDMVDIVDAFAQSPATSFFTGVVSVFAGFALLAFHHRIANVASAAITLLSALIVVRGGVLLFAPKLIDETAAYLNETPNSWTAVGAALALLGAWLTTIGFSAKPPNIAS